MQKFPRTRHRRLRLDSFSRDLVAETNLSVNDLIYPMFIVEGNGIKDEIKSMPDQFRYSIDMLIEEASIINDLKIPAVALFPFIENDKKSIDAKEAYNDNGLVQRAIKNLKSQFPKLGIISDVALDPYTLSGQDGIIDSSNYVLNEKTIEILVKQALSHAKAGADIVAPSDMMDGRIGVIRDNLESHGYINTKILSYSAKYASCFYGPFRDAVGSKINLGKFDKKSYQQDYRNINESLTEASLDLSEGADIIMVKPAIFYLDVIQKIKETFKSPTFAFNVSGEYSMIMNGINNGYFDKQNAILECLTSIKRSGADAIISYFSKEAAKWL